MLRICSSQIVRNGLHYLAWSFLFPFVNLFSWWYGFTFQKKRFWKEQFPTRITSLLRPPLYNGHFPLFKVAAIERLDCTSIINRMLNGLFCKTGHHFTVKLHEIKTRLLAQNSRFRFSRSVEFLIGEISGTKRFLVKSITLTNTDFFAVF